MLKLFTKNTLKRLYDHGIYQSPYLTAIKERISSELLKEVLIGLYFVDANSSNCYEALDEKIFDLLKEKSR